MLEWTDSAWGSDVDILLNYSDTKFVSDKLISETADDTKVLIISHGCCIEFKIYYFILYLFQVINDSILKIMMLIFHDAYESGILLKNHVTLNHLFYLFIGSENSETCIPVWIEQLKE